MMMKHVLMKCNIWKKKRKKIIKKLNNKSFKKILILNINCTKAIKFIYYIKIFNQFQERKKENDESEEKEIKTKDEYVWFILSFMHAFILSVIHTFT